MFDLMTIAAGIGAVVFLFLAWRMPGPRGGESQTVILKTAKTPWQIVRADIVNWLKFILYAAIVGLAVAWLLFR